MTSPDVMKIAEFFPSSYLDARSKFRAACERAGIEYQSITNPRTEVEGQVLTTEVARIGSSEAKKLLVLISGVHGLEGFCGSGCQVGWIAQGGRDQLPDDTAVLIIHFANPYGGAFLSRTTEEGVDLNRNFIDWGVPLPRNDNYAKLHADLCYSETSAQKEKQAETAIENFQREYGMPAYFEAISGAQYEFEDGLFFGGHQSTWSRKNIERILLEQAGQAKHIAIIDFHTGVGPYGYGMPVTFAQPANDGLARAFKWYGPSLLAVNAQAENKDLVGDVSGSLIESVPQLLPDAEITAIALEFGTYPFENSFPVFREDHRLGLVGERHSPAAKKLKEELLEIFYPASNDWREIVWLRASQVIGQALAGLQSAQ